MPNTFVLPRQVGFLSGLIAPSSVLRFYQTATSTPQNVYTDAALTNAVTSLTADSAGVFAKVYLNPNAAANYRVTLENSVGAISYTEDDIDRLPASKASIISALLDEGYLFSIHPKETSQGLVAGDLTFGFPVGHAHRYGAIGDGDGAGGGTNDSAAIQVLFNLLRDQGGEGIFDGRRIYRCSSGLTLLSNSATPKAINVAFNNCLLDFKNLTGSAIGLRYGATSLANAHEAETVTIGAVRLLGPETNGAPTTHAAMTTTTTGVSLEYCLHWTLQQHEVIAFYKAAKSHTSWNNLFMNWHVRNSWVGFHFETLNTYSTFVGCAFMQCSVGALMQGVDAIECQNFISCRFEGNHIHVHLDADPGAAGSTYPIRDIAFNNCYYEAATYDWFRVGMDYTISADPATRGTTNASGYVLNLRVIGGEWANNVLAPGSGTAAFCFDSADGINTFVKAMVFEGPISLAQRCRGRPSKSTWKNTVNPEHGTDNIESFGIGEFSANLTMTSASVTLGRSKGNISSVAHVSDGIFDVTFREAYTATAEYTVLGSAANAVVTISNTSATVCRVTVRDFAGTAAFAATVHLFGEGRMA